LSIGGAGGVIEVIAYFLAGLAGLPGSSGLALGGRPPLFTTLMISTTEGSYSALYEAGFTPALSSRLWAVLGVIFSSLAISSMVIPSMLPLSERFRKKNAIFQKNMSKHIDNYKICRYT
jgi:hypothetical protein